MPFQARLNQLQAILKNHACDALWLEDKINLFYLTGMELSAGKLLVHTQGAVLFVDGRYLETCQKNSPFPVRLIDSHGLHTQLDAPEFNFIHTLAFDSDKTSYGSFVQLSKMTKSLKKNAMELVPLEAPLLPLRLLKDAAEIELLKQAADLGSAGFDFVCTLLKAGISEEEVAMELEIFWKRRGGKTVAFDPIIAFGQNSSMPHYRAGKARLQPNQVVLIDIGVNYQNYHSDMTRIAFFGEPDPRIIEIHQIVWEAQQAALVLCRPGTTLGELDDAARSLIAAHGYAENFTHSLGHGVGLEIHEYPVIRNTAALGHIPLIAGMVITIEPGIYLPGLGGIRIEDTVVITADGCENLTKRATAPVQIHI